MKLYTVKSIKSDFNRDITKDIFSSFDFLKAISFAKNHYLINASDAILNEGFEYFNVNIESSIIEEHLSSVLVWTTLESLQSKINSTYNNNLDLNKIIEEKNSIILNSNISKRVVNPTIADLFNKTVPSVVLGVNDYTDYLTHNPYLDLYNIDTLFKFDSLNDKEFEDELDWDLYYRFEEPLIRKK